MNLQEFQQILDADSPPEVPDPLKALWHQANEDWEEAHNLVQNSSSPDAAWVHAHLHRCEGDLNNASYWYGIAGRPAPGGDLQNEWRLIAEELLEET